MFINLTNHPSALWSREQLQGASRWGNVVDFPFPNVPPTYDEKNVEDLAGQILEEIAEMKPACVLCQGEMTLTYHLVNRMKNMGIQCVAACTDRVSEETTLPDGSVTRKTVFHFIQFRSY